MALKTPVDLHTKLSDPHLLLRIELRDRPVEVIHPDTTPQGPMGMPPGGMPGGGRFGPGGRGLVGGGGGMAGFAGGLRQVPGDLPPEVQRAMDAARRGQAARAQQSGAAADQPSGDAKGASMTTMRMVITTTDGKKSEIYIPVNLTQPDKDGWRQLGIPLAAIAGFDRTNMIVKDVAFSAETPSSFYIGEMGMVEDTTPIDGNIYVRGSRGPDDWEVMPVANTALEDEVTFRAYGTAGATLLKYEWNFDATEHPGEVDVVGPVLKRTFRQAGTFTITLTMKDKYGVKAPVVKSMVVTVNPG
jgi:hypothetical protein